MHHQPGNIGIYQYSPCIRKNQQVQPAGAFTVLDRLKVIRKYKILILQVVLNGILHVTVMAQDSYAKTLVKLLI